MKLQTVDYPLLRISYNRFLAVGGASATMPLAQLPCNIPDSALECLLRYQSRIARSHPTIPPYTQSWLWITIESWVKRGTILASAWDSIICWHESCTPRQSWRSFVHWKILTISGYISIRVDRIKSHQIVSKRIRTKQRLFANRVDRDQSNATLQRNVQTPCDICHLNISEPQSAPTVVSNRERI